MPGQPCRLFRSSGYSARARSGSLQTSRRKPLNPDFPHQRLQRLCVVFVTVAMSSLLSGCGWPVVVLSVPPTAKRCSQSPVHACESGETGRRAGFRILWGNPCGFDSRLSHSAFREDLWRTAGSRFFLTEDSILYAVVTFDAEPHRDRLADSTAARTVSAWLRLRSRVSSRPADARDLNKHRTSDG